MPALCVVIVLYRQRAMESRTVRTLRDALLKSAALAGQLCICIYDNSPLPQPVPDDLFAVETLVFQPGFNGGLPPAYNQALAIAEARQATWLLLLDSDTEITPAFLSACLGKTGELENVASIAAIVPHVAEAGTVHSPRTASWLRRKAIPVERSGIFEGELIALNSGAVLRVSAIRSLGGFTGEFWLDYLDYWLFRTLQRKGFQLYVLDALLAHSLSLADPGRQMPAARYLNMLEAERYFTKRYGSRWENLRLKLVLLARALRFTLRPLTWSFVPLTMASIFRRGKISPPQPPWTR